MPQGESAHPQTLDALVVFSYWGGAIRAYRTLRSFGYDAPKPDEFGAAGRNWSQIGYRADVDYVRLIRPVAPRDAWSEIRPLLPQKYSPLNAANGRGLQSVYLAALPSELGELLRRLVAEHGNPLQAQDARGLLVASAEEPERENWERHEMRMLEQAGIEVTEREALIVSPVADEKSLVKLGVDPERPPDVGRFSKEQERFLEFHRTDVFRSAVAK